MCYLFSQVSTSKPIFNSLLQSEQKGNEVTTMDSTGQAVVAENLEQNAGAGEKQITEQIEQGAGSESTALAVEPEK